MSNAGGNNDVGTITEYEKQKLANIERNKRRLEALNIPRLDTMVRPVRPKKMSKKTHTTNNATTEPHNLRPRTQRNVALAEQQLRADIQAADDFLAEYEDVNSGDQNNGTPKKKKGGRGITRKEDIFSRTPDMPKIPILLNDRGQPVDKQGRKFSSALGCQVRKKLSVGCHDWRLVDAEKKYALWTDLKAIFDLDDDAFDWFMRTAGKKWKEFKATLKKSYFKPNVEYTDLEVSKSRDKRVNDADWKFLFTYWMSVESKARAEKAKANREKLQVPHTLGSLSYACSEHDLAIKLGRPPRRDENFIKAHTRKNGVPSREAGPIINKLKAIVEENPELKNKTIHEGDAFAAVCGEKEPKGYVRVWGLGPTPQDVGTPGLKCYKPTRLQMEIFARKKVEKEKMALQKEVDQLKSQLDQREQRPQQDRTSAEPMSQNGSTSRLHVNATSDQTFMGEEDEPEEDYDAGDDLNDEGYQNLPGQVHDTAPSRRASHITTTPTSNDGACSEHDGAPSENDDRVGKEAILYAMISRSDQPVAKGTIISTKLTTIVGGQYIGSQFCEVIVTDVFKRDAILPRPYLGMNTVGDAKMMGIAWPYGKLKICIKEARPPASGCIGR